MNEQQRKDPTPPTLVDVEQLTTRLEALQQQESALAIKETTIATEITAAHINGLDEKALNLLAYNRREAREDREDIALAIPLLQSKIKELREAACLGEASKRMRGIGKAFGSLLSEIAEDEVRVEKQASAYAQEVERLNSRFLALSTLRLEASALSDRFGVAAPTFQPAVLPALREGCIAAAVIASGVTFTDHQHRPPKTEKCEHEIRTRRTYREIKGTPAGLIIESAGGPKPWPDLTPKQKEIVAARERERQAEAATVARFKGEAARGLERTGLG